MTLPGFTARTYAVDLILATGERTRRHVFADTEAEALTAIAEKYPKSTAVGIGEWSAEGFPYRRIA